MKYELQYVKCRKKYNQDEKAYQCLCGGKLDVRMNLHAVNLSRDELARRECVCSSVIEKYFEILPLPDKKIL